MGLCVPSMPCVQCLADPCAFWFGPNGTICLREDGLPDGEWRGRVKAPDSDGQGCARFLTTPATDTSRLVPPPTCNTREGQFHVYGAVLLTAAGFAIVLACLLVRKKIRRAWDWVLGVRIHSRCLARPVVVEKAMDH